MVDGESFPFSWESLAPLRPHGELYICSLKIRICYNMSTHVGPSPSPAHSLEGTLE